MFTKKDRKIANLTVMVENRDKLIKGQEETIETLRKVIISLEEDLKETRAINYENACNLEANTCKDKGPKKEAKKRTSRQKKSN